MIELAGKDSEVRNTDRLWQEPENVQGVAERREQDAMEARRDVWCILGILSIVIIPKKKNSNILLAGKKAPFVFTFTNVKVVQRTTTTLDVWREEN